MGPRRTRWLPIALGGGGVLLLLAYGQNVLAAIDGFATLLGVYKEWKEEFEGKEWKEGSEGVKIKPYDALMALVTAVGQFKEAQSTTNSRDSRPLPVSWTLMGTPVSDRWARIRRDEVDEVPEPNGHPQDIMSFLIDGRFHRRIVILGDKGAGKTFALNQLSDELLCVAGDTALVPVLLRLSTWDPIKQNIDEWIKSRISEDYGRGASIGGGSNHTEPLITLRNLVPLLDGLDEMPVDRHRKALRAINNWMDKTDGETPIVLTSRNSAYNKAIEGDGVVLFRAAVMKLLPLDPSETLDYLVASTTNPEKVDKWRRIFTQDSIESGGRLGRALSTPLFASLARIAYGAEARDPDELLQLPDEETIQNRLLDQIIVAAYPECAMPGIDGPVCETQRWLTEIARRLLSLEARSGSQSLPRNEIAWWRFIDTIPRFYRSLGGFLPLALCGGLIFGLLFGPFGAAGGGIAFGAVGVMAILRPSRPARRSVTIRRNRDPMAQRIRRALAYSIHHMRTQGLAVGPPIGLVFGFAGALALGFSDRPVLGYLRWEAGLAGAVLGVLIGAAFELLGGLIYEFSTMFDEHADVEHAPSPRSVLTNDHWAAVPGEILFGLAAGLGLGFIGGFSFGFAGFALAFLMGWLMSAAGQFVIARIVLAGRGQLPLSLMNFLADAHTRDVLRQLGGIYQFRHDLLLDRLVRSGGHSNGRNAG